MPLLAGLQHPRQPGPRLLGRDAVRVGVGVAGELVDLVAEGHPDEVRPVGEGGGQGAQVLGLPGEDVRVGEEVAPVPRTGPGGQEVEARQVALEPVHIDVEAAFGGGVGELDELLDGARADQGAVGLEERPEREDPDVVEPEAGDRVQVGAYGVEVEVQPVVEPALAGRVVGAETQGEVLIRNRSPGSSGARGRPGQPLTAPSPTPRKKKRWSPAKSTMSGSTAMIVPAATSRSSLAKVPCR